MCIAVPALASLVRAPIMRLVGSLIDWRLCIHAAIAPNPSQPLRSALGVERRIIAIQIAKNSIGKVATRWSVERSHRVQDRTNSTSYNYPRICYHY